MLLIITGIVAIIFPKILWQRGNGFQAFSGRHDAEPTILFIWIARGTSIMFIIVGLIGLIYS